jgi:hypothetical protein
MIAAFAAPAAADESDKFEIYGLKLGQHAPDPSDATGLQVAFGPTIAKDLKGLMLVETGAPHYLLDLGNDRTLGIWFDDASAQRRIYWLDLVQKFDFDPSGDPMAGDRGRAVKEALQGKFDFDIAPAGGPPLRRAMVAIDARLPPMRKTQASRHISGFMDMHAPATDTTFAEFPPNDPQFRLELLGEQFRGRMISLYGTGSWGIELIETELFDGALARGALLPQPQ